jgi:hypothetical protein
MSTFGLRDSDGTPSLAALIVIAFAYAFLLLFLQGDVQFGLMDEGFIWYGGWRVTLGEVPIRDFEAYDPGRYYWTALWFRLLGPGLETLRVSFAVFQAIGLTFGLLVLRRIEPRWWLVLAGGVILCFWMFPRFKPFEPAIAMASVFFAVRLLESPTAVRHFAAGTFLGLAAWFGRNHGLYGGVTFAIVMGIALWKIDRSQPVKKIAAFALGVLVGYLPMLYMLAFVPGFFDAYIDRLIEHFRLGYTNVSKPVPWPWDTFRENVGQMGVIVTLRSMEFLMGAIIVLWPPFVAGSLAYILTRRQLRQGPQLVLAAGAAAAIGYYHYLLSRPIPDYLAMSILPALLAVMAIPFLIRERRWLHYLALAAMLGAVSLTSFYIAGKMSYLYKKLNLTDLQETEIGGLRLKVLPMTADVVKALDTIKRDYLAEGDRIIVLPFWPSAYVMLDRRSPIWDNYIHFPRTEERQREIIRELDQAGVKWAIVGDVAIDGQESWRMKHQNPLLWRYFQEDFEEIPLPHLPEHYRFLKRRAHADADGAPANPGANP